MVGEGNRAASRVDKLADRQTDKQEAPSSSNSLTYLEDSTAPHGGQEIPRHTAQGSTWMGDQLS